MICDHQQRTKQLDHLFWTNESHRLNPWALSGHQIENELDLLRKTEEARCRRGDHQQYIVFDALRGFLNFLENGQVFCSALSALSVRCASSCTLVVPDFGPTFSGNSDMNGFNSNDFRHWQGECP
jgi:hypothetical protein